MNKVLIKPKKKIVLNAMQMCAIEANRTQKAKHINIEAGRGTGKSTILGWYMKEAVRQMPRATGVLVGATFVQIKSRTLPSTKEGLEMFGLYENIDYVVGRSGYNEGFELPFQAPNSWSNVIHFRNGFIWIMVSLDDPNSGRGLNSYIVMGDEAALLEYERLFNNVLTTNRAKKTQFDKCTLVNASIFASSVALTQTGEWFTKREELALKKPNEYCFIKANAYINKENLKKGWFEEMREQAISELIFNAEILNIRPRGVTEGFYAQLEPSRHYYQYKYDLVRLGNMTDPYTPSSVYDTDVVKAQPLLLSLDFGGRINCGIVSQYIKSLNQVNILKDFFMKNPKKLSDLITAIADYYEPHKHSCNEIYIYHDRSGFKSEANSKTSLAQDVENLLRARGWKVFNQTPNTNNPAHTAKFRFINAVLSEDTSNLPRIRINKDNCPNLIVSMENAGLSYKNDAFEKDKKPERSITILQEHATHLSDCFDYLLWWRFSYLFDYNYFESYPVSSF
ncbi:hypothetical protein [Capnocytophaga canis]|uniref:Phage terminase large subunit N-terminal domain-containing protein n=1 Tax=Capnocytophaga canis TaxID=1848903 RepID=A0A0B7IRA4_9FLAO|nr:hypothetical protein [Capnocytophaga canis]CEN54421.1 conserved hypothetical protein [Capnocytophaga canis]